MIPNDTIYNQIIPYDTKLVPLTNDIFNRQTLCLADCAKAKQDFDTLEKFIPL
jgi:hypothetical protein